MTAALDERALAAAHLSLNPDALTAAHQAHKAHAADPGRKGDGIAKAILTYLTALPQGEAVTVPREPTEVEGAVQRLRKALAALVDDIRISTERWGDSTTGPATVPTEPGDLPVSQEAFDEAVAALAAAPASPSGLDARTVEAAVVAGWNACRKSLYAVCEDIQEQADALRISAPVTTAAAEQHSKGYHAGSNFAAKSIARGFNSMEAMDDDNALAALRSLTQETTK